VITNIAVLIVALGCIANAAAIYFVGKRVDEVLRIMQIKNNYLEQRVMALEPEEEDSIPKDVRIADILREFEGSKKK
jgi:hypothetical protein